MSTLGRQNRVQRGSQTLSTWAARMFQSRMQARNTCRRVRRVWRPVLSRPLLNPAQNVPRKRQRRPLLVHGSNRSLYKCAARPPATPSYAYPSPVQILPLSCCDRHATRPRAITAAFADSVHLRQPTSDSSTTPVNNPD